jgi:hypothetical protein
MFKVSNVMRRYKKAHIINICYICLINIYFGTTKYADRIKSEANTDTKAFAAADSTNEAVAGSYCIT